MFCAIVRSTTYRLREYELMHSQCVRDASSASFIVCTPLHMHASPLQMCTSGLRWRRGRHFVAVVIAAGEGVEYGHHPGPADNVDGFVYRGTRPGPRKVRIDICTALICSRTGV